MSKRKITKIAILILLMVVSNTFVFKYANLKETIEISGISYSLMNNLLKVFLCLLIDLLLYIVIRKSKSVLILAQDLYNSRTIIWSLAKNDFKTKYAGSI